MATGTGTIEYMPSATNGSAAYSLDRVLGFGNAGVYELPGEQTREEERVRERERAVPKTRTRVRTQPKSARISVFAVFGYLVAAAMLVLVMLSYVQLAEISGNMTELENEYAELTEKGKQLTIAYERAFNLADVEYYAVNSLNMTKLTDRQITVLNIEKPDKAEILETEKSKGLDIIAGSAEFISSLMSYLK